MNNKIGNKISEGACAEVFEWEDSKKIIKLAKTNTSPHAMQTEFYNSKAAWDNGLSVPQPFELVEIDGRLGIVFERIYGETLKERFVNQFLSPSSTGDRKKNIDYKENSVITAKILSEMHKKSIEKMPSQRKSIINSIERVNYLTTLEKKSVIDILNNLPIKRQLCHGDPNPNNIFIRENEALLIDWMDASIGNPEADLAEYILMNKFAVLPPDLSKEMVHYFDSVREEIIKVFIDEYTKLSDITTEEIEPWIIPMAARKLSASGIIEAEKQLLVDEIRRRLKTE